MRAGPTSGHRCSPSSPRRICISRSMPSRRMRMASSVASSSGVGPACCCGPAAAVRVRIAANSVVISLSVRSRRASRACQCRSRSASKARRVVGAGAAARSGLTASQAGRTGGTDRVAATRLALCGSAHSGPAARATSRPRWVQRIRIVTSSGTAAGVVSCQSSSRSPCPAFRALAHQQLRLTAPWQVETNRDAEGTRLAQAHDSNHATTRPANPTCPGPSR